MMLKDFLIISSLIISTDNFSSEIYNKIKEYSLQDKEIIKIMNNCKTKIK